MENPRDNEEPNGNDWHPNETLLAYWARVGHAQKNVPDVPERREGVDPEANWQRFWKEIIMSDEGNTVNLEQVKRELADYSMLMSWVPRVYMHVTGGRVSKTNTWPSVVCALSDEVLSQRVEEEVAEALKHRDDQVLTELQQLCGYVENGTDTSIRLFQDDATKSWVVKIGEDQPERGRMAKSYWADSIRAVLKLAAESEGDPLNG